MLVICVCVHAHACVHASMRAVLNTSPCTCAQRVCACACRLEHVHSCVGINSAAIGPRPMATLVVHVKQTDKGVLTRLVKVHVLAFLKKVDGDERLKAESVASNRHEKLPMVHPNLSHCTIDTHLELLASHQLHKVDLRRLRDKGGKMQQIQVSRFSQLLRLVQAMLSRMCLWSTCS